MLLRRGFEIVESRALYEWQRRHGPGPGFVRAELPAGAVEYLRSDNPRLHQLQDRYREFDKRVTTPFVWQEGYVQNHDILYFRGDNAYVYQLRGQNMNVLGYALSTYYAKSIDELGLLDRVDEDGTFGIHTFEVDGRRVSRDLLDSIVEIYFLERHLGISKLASPNVLDIGAGYGRLAHRMAVGMPNIGRYLCTDAIPVSSFICEYYLRRRKVEQRAVVAPLDELDAMMASHPIDLAINIHSFSECSLEAIDWWLEKLSSARVKSLFIIPNKTDAATHAPLTNDGKDFGVLVRKHGYELTAREPKYRDPVVQQYGINPAYHYLFQLTQ